MEKRPVAYQLYSAREEAEKNLDAVLGAVKRMGYEIAHCTWHPGSSAPNPTGNFPYRGKYCLDK